MYNNLIYCTYINRLKFLCKTCHTTENEIILKLLHFKFLVVCFICVLIICKVITQHFAARVSADHYSKKCLKLCGVVAALQTHCSVRAT